MTIVGPDEGRLASGMRGRGRMVEPEAILGALRQLLGRSGDLAGRKVVVSAGGTQEPIDPVRYVGNYSSGKMGYAIAEAARDRGALVALVSAPVALSTPYGVEKVAVTTAEEMRDAVVAGCAGADVLIMAAAVADYRPVARAEQKIKRYAGGADARARADARHPGRRSRATSSAWASPPRVRTSCATPPRRWRARGWT